jgi:hypothetical protein
MSEKLFPRSALVFKGFWPKVFKSVLNGFRAPATFAQVIVNVAIRIGQGKGIYRRREVPTKSSLAVAVFTLHSMKSDLAILHLATTSLSVFFGKLAQLHLVHE